MSEENMREIPDRVWVVFGEGEDGPYFQYWHTEKPTGERTATKVVSYVREKEADQ